ncbi:hypothetical protein GCM10011521_11790 [Arenimonas soli]|uniref:Uncharacterized protein n=1 Tax=Arenimonas soli TaxID=2269504 RepID=A0ABQ1HFL9_9GAMM|nr:hypothetical protein GCM10011521_11790 [Arenimonas soli]
MLVAQKAAFVALDQQELRAAVARLAARGQFLVALLFHGLEHEAGAFTPLHAGQRLDADLGFGQATAVYAEPPGAADQRGNGDDKGGYEGAEAEHPVTPIQGGGQGARG